MAEFDQYGRLKNPNFRQSRPVSSFVPSATYSRESGWQRFNGFISDIGEWLRDNCSALANNISIGGFFIACIAIIIGAIYTWIDDGFVEFIIYAIVAALVMYFGGLLVTGLMMIVLNIPIYILGIIFHSAYSLIITILLALGITIYCNYDNNSYSSSHNTYSPKIEQTVKTQTTSTPKPTTTRYKCTANSGLNIRKLPNANSQVLGTISNNQIIEVYSITNGFAKIKYKSSYGYVSCKYIQKI